VPAYDFFVARCTASGSLDSSFGHGGWMETDFSNPRDFASAVVVQSDGKIVVAGGSNDESGITYGTHNFDFCMARYNPDGWLDPSFGSGGKVVTQSFGKGRTRDLLRQGDGKLILAGTTIYTDFALLRYNANGSLDTSFGSGGFVDIDFGNTDWAIAAALQADGKIVVVGSTDGPSGNSALARLTSNGSLDTSFGNGGTVITDVDEYDRCMGVAIQGDGRIVTSMSTQHFVELAPGTLTSISNIAAARYLGGDAPQPADLAIQMTDSPDPVSVGQILTYRVTVTNTEFIYPKAAHVTWQDTLPAGTEFVSLQVPSGWVVFEKPAVGGTGKVSCSTYALLPGQSAQFTLAVRVRSATSGATISNTVQVKSLTPDPASANNKKTNLTSVN
jgi:uncharacterized delta-60 repeat protein/uncharacterized repeat protein (TIGR01451 family)